MLTPFGELAALDTANFAVLANVLKWDKHALLEGMIAEDLVDQILDRVPDGQNITPLRVRTCIAACRGSRTRYAFVWSREAVTTTIRPYLEVLAARHDVYVVAYDAGRRDFLVTRNPYVGGEPTLPDELLHDALRRITNRTPDLANLPRTEIAVRDRIRQNQAIWGFLNVLYGRNIYETAVLPRIFMNFGVQPFFDFAWDVDRVFLVNGTVSVIEVKHKYPFPAGNPANFGLNTGSMMLIENLVAGGATCYHLVLVKPYWDETTSSMYLLGNLEAREKALLVGCRIDAAEIAAAGQRRKGETGAKTTLSGTGVLKYIPMPLTGFHLVGSLAAPLVQNASRIGQALGGRTLPGLTAADLTNNRMR